jgi:hypothetical protein
VPELDLRFATPNVCNWPKPDLQLHTYHQHYIPCIATYPVSTAHNIENVRCIAVGDFANGLELLRSLSPQRETLTRSENQCRAVSP